MFFIVEGHPNIFFTFSFSCSDWSDPSPSNQSCAARVWTTFSSAAMVTRARLPPLLPHLHPHHLLPPFLSPPWPTSDLPPFPRLLVPTRHCPHFHLPSVPHCLWPQTPSQSPRPCQCSRSRRTVSRSTSSAGLPTASDVNTWSKVGNCASYFKRSAFMIVPGWSYPRSVKFTIFSLLYACC